MKTSQAAQIEKALRSSPWLSIAPYSRYFKEAKVEKNRLVGKAGYYLEFKPLVMSNNHVVTLEREL
jgi:hypothetical protein